MHLTRHEQERLLVSLCQRLRVERAGRPLLCTELAIGPRWPTSDGPAGLGDARVVASTLLVGAPARRRQVRHPEGDDQPTEPARWATLDLSDDAVLLTALAADVDAARAAAGWWEPRAATGSLP